MKVLAVFLILASLSVAVGQTTSPQSTYTQSRRAYPGGRDDSDLTVQKLKTKPTKQDLEATQAHGPEEEDTEGGQF
ncbi:MAG: hypothetical protein IT289_12680 [Oligoflexia bacterium]|nr:hypothetical protein [Oligoflexia bacterium]